MFGGMKIVTRYVLGELLLVFGFTLAAMTAFMILLGVALEAAKQGLGPEPIMRLVPYVMPNALRFAVPAAILFAACAVYGRMAASNEIIAVKTMGISPMAIFWPGFVLAFAVSLAAVWLNDLAASWGREGIQRVVLESVEQIVYGTLRTHRSYRASDRLAITVRRVDGRRLIQPTITTQDADGRMTTITASEAELRGRPEANSLTLRLWDAVIETGGRGKLTWPGMFEHDIPLRDATKNGDKAKHPTDYALKQIPVEVGVQRRLMDEQAQAMAADAACQLMMGEFTSLANPDWDARHQSMRQQEARLYRLLSEPWRRWANGFSCFFFVWVGAPLAARLRNSDMMSTFGLVFLPILVVYYPLMQFGVDQAKTGALPPYCVWSGNLILSIVGLLLLRPVLRQ